MDFSDFYQTFFDEADELLADMEKHLLELDFASPDTESLNAIFRAAHSIKGGAGTFGFIVLQETTHILENLLDDARRGELQLSNKIVNLFLESKDIMQDQLDAYKSSQEPDQERFKYICEALRQMAEEAKQGYGVANAQIEAPIVLVEELLADQALAAEVITPAPVGASVIQVELRKLRETDRQPLINELGLLGTVENPQYQGDTLTLVLKTSESQDDIRAVLSFLLDDNDIILSVGAVSEPAAPVVDKIEPKEKIPPTAPKAEPPVAQRKSRAPSRSQGSESSSIRVAVEKVDQIINQVGELIITQAMLTQLSTQLDPAKYEALISSIAQLERNARDLQQSVMSTRMMPMEYVFSRFPRLVHDLAGKLDKQVELTLVGGSAELDKSVIERIIDPLTHLVRNSLDHGIESMATRRANGKPEQGNLTLSAEHHGGNIIIEVIDDGVGLNREKNSGSCAIPRVAGQR